jgi:ribose 5-phosphate isomerase A
MDAKRRAAEAAVPLVSSGMAVGLGTGSTADYFLKALAAALASGQLGKVGLLDLTVDGADEVDPQLQVIKGLGGALVREKIVAQNSRRLVIIADEGKLVKQLGTKAPLPVEVVQFAAEVQERFFRSIGAEPTLRKVGGMVFNTDNGNLIYDCRFPTGIADPVATERLILDRAGVVGCGLFLGMADVVLVGSEDGVKRMDRAG